MNDRSTLTGSQRQRGLYMNAGNRDVGVDPDWDPINRRWKGFDKKDADSSTHNTLSDEQNR